MGQVGPGGLALQLWGDCQELAASLRLCGWQGRGGKGRRVWLMGQAQVRGDSGDPIPGSQGGGFGIQGRGDNDILSKCFLLGQPQGLLQFTDSLTLDESLPLSVPLFPQSQSEGD